VGTRGAQAHDEATAPATNRHPGLLPSSRLPRYDFEREVVELSPFTVNTTKDAGYYAENTLAGSRLNTNLATSRPRSLLSPSSRWRIPPRSDINDVFRYEASTEGSSTTAGDHDRSTAKDVLGGYTFGNDGTTTTNAQANRIRGLTAPDAAINNFPSANRIPFDAYNIQSVESPAAQLAPLWTRRALRNCESDHHQGGPQSRYSEVTVRTDQLRVIPHSLDGQPVLDSRQAGVRRSLRLLRRAIPAQTVGRSHAPRVWHDHYKPFKGTTIRAFGRTTRTPPIRRTP